ncbi:MAG TPA: prolyl oligopeptidase family serine peptidase, partial [Candidatus Poseidonia sp.]|nr:prolyl oligopeptidase family serine peptidase [Poseidonia sp.]
YENSWNAGDICCGIAHEEDVDDLNFIIGMVEHLIATQPVNPDRIYLSGWSNGCGMTQMLVVEASELFAAAGCMSFYL